MVFENLFRVNIQELCAYISGNYISTVKDDPTYLMSKRLEYNSSIDK